MSDNNQKSLSEFVQLQPAVAAAGDVLVSAPNNNILRLVGEAARERRVRLALVADGEELVGLVS